MSIHAHPREVARLIVVALECIGPEAQVLLESRVFGQVGGGAKVPSRATMLLGVGLGVGHRGESPVLVSPDQRVEALEGCHPRGGCIQRRLELPLGHVSGVEVGARRLGPHTLQERGIAVHPVPGAVIDLREAPQLGIAQRFEQAVGVPKGLLPVMSVVSWTVVYLSVSAVAVAAASSAGVARSAWHPRARIAVNARVVYNGVWRIVSLRVVVVCARKNSRDWQIGEAV
jgi:hypothetical protein